jgi:hypothetical protein
MKCLTPLLQCSYQHCRWQTGVTVQRALQVAVEYLFCSRESWSSGKADYIYIYIYIYINIYIYISLLTIKTIV